jgi:transcription-repair coupling factor (superfamily II helicase)
MEMLEDAVDRLKSGRPQAKKIETAVEIPVTAYFPISYIADEETRIELYRRLSRCSDTMMLDLIKEECDDRFGTLPEDSLNLFKISRLRIIAAQAGVKKISRVINHLRFEFADEFLPDLGALMQTDNPLVKDIFVNPADQKALNLNVANEDVAETFFVAEMLLNLLINIRLEASSETE